MPDNTSTVGALLHDVYAPGIQTQLQNETPLIDSFQTVKQARIVGRNRVRGIKVNRNRGGYYTAEGGAPPVAGRVQIEEFKIPLRYYHHAVSWTEQVLDASSTDQGAFADAMRLEMEDVVDGIKIQRNQALWSDGRGVRCLVNGAATTTTVTVDSPGGIAGAADGTRFLNVGDWVAAVTPGGALRQTTAYQITAILSETQFQTNAAVTWTDNDFVVKCVETTGTLAIQNTEWQHPPMGMNGMIDAGAWVNIIHALSRTTFPILNSTVIGTTAAPVGALSADLLQRAIDTSHKVGGGQTDEIWFEPSVKRSYLKLMEQDRRYTAADLYTPQAGTTAADVKTRYADTGLRFGKIPIMQDFNAPYGFAFGLDKRNAYRFPGPEGWVDRGGVRLFLSSTQVDTWESWYRHFENYCHEQPNRCWKLVGITHDLVYVHVV